MNPKHLITILVSLFILNACSNDDDSNKVRISLLKTVEVTYPASSLSNYTLTVDYNNDNTINTVVKTLADNSTFRFACSYNDTKKLAAVGIESPSGSSRTIEFQYTPQDILFQIEEHIEGSINAFEINYNSLENNYSSLHRTWFFDDANNFEGYFFSSEAVHTFEYNNSKGIENFDIYIPILIYETLNGLGFASDFNFISPNQNTNSAFEELTPGGITVNYRNEQILNTQGLLGSTTTYVNDETSIFSIKTYTYETKFQ
ncbi:hypothetical protein U1E44_14605 [Arenibacter sp. GZD96]|uniref:hypothetical protein n=1 Tax=Aurantibrevibacter litoralis TaxID=3106030 RepID=UPI002AFF6355|nr:hypothetical protein [Arenibacter sp. GZD-96]MEA1787330.1 hypothetical protein [Arenibacter sp. GZD-96]